MTGFCQFSFNQFLIRITAQKEPVAEQNAHKVFSVQRRILRLCSPEFRRDIEHLREAGLRVDWAFAGMLKLGEDPTRKLALLNTLTNQNLLERIQSVDKTFVPAPQLEILTNSKSDVQQVITNTMPPGVIATPFRFQQTRQKFNPTKVVGNFQQYVRLGVWGWLVKDKSRLVIRPVDELRHDFSAPKTLLRIVYHNSGVLGEVLVTVESAYPSATNEKGETTVELEVSTERKVATGQHPIVAIWVRKVRCAA